MTTRKLRVAIVGGGIGGLTCAAALKDCHDIEIDLFEAAAKFVAIGAGIVTWPRTHACFKALGVNDEVLEAVLNTRKESSCKETEPSRPSWTFHNGKDGSMIYEHYIKEAEATNLHRQKLLDLLLSQLPSASHCRIHFGHRLAGCRELPDSVELSFRNGAVGSFDLVIGADGLKSVVRQAVVRDLGYKERQSGGEGDGEDNQCYLRSDILYTGQSAFRALIPRERLVEVWPDHRALYTPTIYCGKSKHLVAYPIQNGEIVNLVAFFSDSRSGSPVIESTSSSVSSSPQPNNGSVTVEAILATYPGWHDEAVELLKMMKDPTIWPIQDLRPLESYVTPRIALLGDAAHAMSPHLGAGACTAIEDAYILGKIIAKSAQGVTNSNDIHQMLDIYNTLRQPYGNEIMRWAHEMGEFYEFGFDSSELVVNSGEDSDLEDGKLSKGQILAFREAVKKNWGWPGRAAGTIEEDMKRAHVMLENAGLV